MEQLFQAAQDSKPTDRIVGKLEAIDDILNGRLDTVVENMLGIPAQPPRPQEDYMAREED